MNPSTEAVPPADKPASPTIMDIVWESAVEAFVRAILVLVMGSVAIGLVGDIFGSMTPSRPPGLPHKLVFRSESVAAWKQWWSAADEHRFLIVFAVLFAVSVSVRLIGTRSLAEESGRPSRWQRAGRQISEEWFSLIVSNAFGAMVSAMVLVWIPQFSISQMLYHSLLEWFLAGLQNIGNKLLGAGRVETINQWFSWYGENQFKFNFWLLYVAAICDDLGLPNFKTLGRFLWRRFRRRGSSSSQRSLPDSDQPQMNTDRHG